jgi:hypothetical protein
MKRLKRLFTIILLLLSTQLLTAQKISYKSGTLSVDGKDIATIQKIKDQGSFGITGTYELYAMSGTKLIIGTIATDYVPDQTDNGSYYYRLTFLTTNQVAIFSLSKFGPEKSFAKLIGESGIIVNDHLDPQKVIEFMALKGKTPATVVTYSTVNRDLFPDVVLNSDGTIKQGFTIIGAFKDVSQGDGVDKYEFSIPSGLVIATVSFRGGIGASQFLISTIKDNRAQTIAIPVGREKTIASSVDRNQSTLIRLANWLVKNQYL